MNCCTDSADIWAMIVSAQNCFFFSTTHALAETRRLLPRSACARIEKNGGAAMQTLISALPGVAKNDQRHESLLRTKGPTPLPAQALLRSADGGARQRYSRSHEGTHLRRSAFGCSPMGGLRVSLSYRPQNYREPAEAPLSSLDCHEVGPRCLFASVVMVS
jgi:hypothetical protein